jgi:biotin operon repressor
MCYRIELDMGISEFAVVRAIQELEQDNEQRIDHDLIAKYIGCSRATVWRATQKLVASGSIKRAGNRATGWVYRTDERWN